MRNFAIRFLSSCLLLFIVYTLYVLSYTFNTYVFVIGFVSFLSIMGFYECCVLFDKKFQENIDTTAFILLVLPIVMLSISKVLFILSMIIASAGLIFTRKGFMYILMPYLYIFFACYIVYANESGYKIIFYILFVAFTTDTAAYLFGTIIRGKKILSHISPNKTISGFVCGILTGTILGSVILKKMFVVFYVEQAYISILIALLLAFMTVIGDLLSSYYKRIMEAKDFGNIIPGHGGVLDRFDGFLLALYYVPVLDILFI